MRLCLMVEGQEGVSWEEWVALARACEKGGLEGLFRSDHYVSTMAGEVRGSLDAWATLAALAPLTSRIRLGTLVSPVTFRHPSVLAKCALLVDHASGGRVEIGMGGGWMDYEHRAFGFPFPDVPTRMEMLAEQVEIVHRLLTEETVTFTGRHYRLEECRPRPAPVQTPRPPIVIGGGARRGTLGPAVRFADEYNTIFPTVDEYRERRARLDRACESAGRDPATLPLSIMTGCVVGRDRAELRERLARRAERSGSDESPEEYGANRAHAMVIGTVEEAAERLRAYEEAGVQRVMLQHLDHADLDMVAVIGDELAPAVSGA
jgi:F420-dependent oxidoreductase-like protein